MINNILAGMDLQTLFMLIVFVVLIAVVIVMYVTGSKKRKQQEKEAQDLINSVKPGNKVKTIGGICGIVVEVDDEENTFVLETGTVASGKSFIKFDRQAIYQTDAKVEKDEKDEKSGKDEKDAVSVAPGDVDLPLAEESNADTDADKGGADGKKSK